MSDKMTQAEFLAKHDYIKPIDGSVQRGVMNHLAKAVKPQPEHKIVKRDHFRPVDGKSMSNPENALQFFDAKYHVASDFIQIAGILRDYVSAYGSMDVDKFNGQDLSTLRQLGELRDCACCTEPRFRNVSVSSDTFERIGSSFTQAAGQDALRQDVMTAGRSSDAYVTICELEDAEQVTGDFTYTIRRDLPGDKRTGPTHEAMRFRSREGAVAFLQACVMAETDNPKVTSDRRPEAAYPGHRQLGISALGYGGYSVEIHPYGFHGTEQDMAGEQVLEHEEHRLYTDVLTSGFIPGGRLAGNTARFPVESFDEFMHRCDFADMRQKDCMGKAPKEPDVISTPHYGPVHDVFDSAARWAVSSPYERAPEDYARAFRSSSRMYKNITGPKSDVLDLAGRPTMHELRNPEEYMDFLASRASQAAALSVDVDKLNTVLSDHGQKAGERHGFTGLTPSYAVLRHLGWMSPGTQCHQTSALFARPGQVDYELGAEHLADNLAERYVMAMYGVDGRAIEKGPACEHPGFDMGKIRSELWNGGMTKELRDFARSTFDELNAERAARDELLKQGKELPFSIEMKSPDGESKKFGFATAGFVTRFVADTIGRDNYYRTRAGELGHEPPPADKLVIKGPLDYDLLRTVKQVGMDIRHGEYAGKALSPFDGPRITEVAREQIAEREKSKNYSLTRGGLDAKADEIESNGSCGHGPQEYN